MDYYGFDWVARPSEEISVMRNYVTPNQAAEEHMHDFYEFAFVLGGTGFHVVDGVNYSVQKGDLIFLNPRVVHQIHTRDYVTNDGKFEYVDLYMSRSFVDNELFHNPYAKEIILDQELQTEDGHRVPVIPVLRLPESKFSFFSSLFQYMCDESKNKEYNYQSILKRLALMIIDETVRYVYLNNGSSIHSVGSITNETIQYIEKHFRDRITLNEVAQMSYMQPSYFCKQFKKYYKMTFVHYIHKRRIETAVELIKRGSVHSISELIEYLGYQERQQFYKYFRLYTGMTPSQLQKTLLKPDGKNNTFPDDTLLSTSDVKKGKT